MGADSKLGKVKTRFSRQIQEQSRLIYRCGEAECDGVKIKKAQEKLPPGPVTARRTIPDSAGGALESSRMQSRPAVSHGEPSWVGRLE